ncbi:MAG: CBS domain-containing protein [Anaerolineaceae bacterium]|nr:CBS domain-containing protein [Anaerolineaceae bacterium]
MTDIPVQNIPTYTRKDFASDQTVRWCPGCGDYAIIAGVQKTLPGLGIPKENIVFISGIGCSSRFPYYMNTYGIHSIHGRAPTLATGLKIARPELSVWVVTGDGDGLSIGGNHLLHACRRNIDLNILLFNNRIYGLTKGQYSPTSLPGTKTKSSPMGSIEPAFNPVAVALGAEATFIARTMDTLTRHLEATLLAAAEHKGTSFVEIFQNCVIFNNGTWEHVAEKSTQDDNALFLEHGQPMIFGKDKDKGLRLNGLRLEVVQLGNGATEADLLVHDETNDHLAYLLTQMDYPDFPVPFGVIYRTPKPSYEELLMGQIHESQAKKPDTDLRALYQADYTWTIEEEAEPEVMMSDTTETMAISGLDEAYMDEMGEELGQLTREMTSQESPYADITQAPIAVLHQNRTPITVTPDTSLAQAITMMQEAGVGALLVVDTESHPVGIFTEGDVLMKIATRVTDLESRTVSEFMTPNPDTLPAHVSIAHALHLMSIHHYRHIPIVDDSGLVQGVVSFRDMVRYIETVFDR